MAMAHLSQTIQHLEAIPHVSFQSTGQFGVVMMMESTKEKHPLCHRLKVNFFGMQLQPKVFLNESSDFRNHSNQGILGVVDEVEVVHVPSIR